MGMVETLRSSSDASHSLQPTKILSICTKIGFGILEFKKSYDSLNDKMRMLDT